MGKYNVIPAYERAGLSRSEAAEFIGVSPTLFDQMVTDGRMPPPKMINSRRVWSRAEVEKYFDALPDGVPYASVPAQSVQTGGEWDSPM